MRRNVIAAIVAVVVFGGTFAFAASLGTITTGTVGDSTVVVASCDTDGVTTSMGSPTWDATAKQYVVSSIDVTGINAACDGKNIAVTLTGSGGASLGEATGTVASSAASLTFSSGVAASSVTGTEIVIAS